MHTLADLGAYVWTEYMNDLRSFCKKKGKKADIICALRTERAPTHVIGAHFQVCVSYMAVGTHLTWLIDVTALFGRI